jgi:hypothetical protein
MQGYMVSSQRKNMAAPRKGMMMQLLAKLSNVAHCLAQAVVLNLSLPN